METSDSEYFESADEDFEPEDQFNKNRTPISTKKSDVNKNEKESSDIKNTNDDNTTSAKIIVAENHVKSDKKLTNIKVESENKNIETVDAIHETSELNKNDVDNNDDNLWNEDEGWGFNDEGDKESDNLSKLTEVKEHIKVETLINNQIESQKDVKKVVTLESKQQNNESNMWDDEDWDNWEKVNSEKLVVDSVQPTVDENNSSSNQIWKGWGNWGVTSILSTATQSVSTLTNSVSHGISSVLENGIGIPDPEEFAKINHTEEKSVTSTETPGYIESQEHENKNLLGFGFGNIGNLVSGVSKLVESTGTKVISGGLDTLETIGKKTMEVIQEGDPGLKKKRAFLNLEGDKPVLSQVLREAKEKAEQENKILQEKHITKKVNYESIFDDHQGLVHLEALEMLSKQCDMKIQTLIESSSGTSLTDIQETLDQVKELCELPDEEEDEQISLEEIKDKLKSAVEDIDINITYNKLISLWEETDCWLNNINLDICDENEIHQQAVETLAQLTAIVVEQFHKAGELLLIKDHHSTADEADSLVQLTITLTSLIGIVAAKFTDKMNSKVTDNVNKENINSLITNIFFEAANSSSYIQDAFQLLVPVLQMGAVSH